MKTLNKKLEKVVDKIETLKHEIDCLLKNKLILVHVLEESHRVILRKLKNKLKKHDFEDANLIADEDSSDCNYYDKYMSQLDHLKRHNFDAVYIMSDDDTSLYWWYLYDQCKMWYSKEYNIK